jgi:hypothetical protein
MGFVNSRAAGFGVTERLTVCLNDSNSQRYRARPGANKHAVIKWEPSQYKLSKGTQDFPGPHVVVLDPAGYYGVDLEVFFTTHQALPELANHYVKTAQVRAWRADRPFELVTRLRGVTEVISMVEVGAFVVQNPQGEQYPMSAEEFLRRYMPED